MISNQLKRIILIRKVESIFKIYPIQIFNCEETKKVRVFIVNLRSWDPNQKNNKEHTQKDCQPPLRPGRMSLEERPQNQRCFELLYLLKVES